MSSANDPRGEERGQLILALATFAVQLDAFEMRAMELLLPVGKANDHLVRSSDWKEDRIGRQ